MPFWLCSSSDESIMTSIGGDLRLAYSRVGRADFDSIASLDLDTVQLDRFLGPLADIAAAVRQGLAHSLVAIRAEGRMVGFYVTHPDRRDGACWWLGWLAFDRSSQGHGFGHTTMTRIMAAFRRLAGCRRVRLLVAPDNACALRLYTRAGFSRVGVHDTGELIFEATLPHPPDSGTRPGVMRRQQAAPGHACHEGRLRRAAGPYAAQMIGVQRGPPGTGVSGGPGRIMAQFSLTRAPSMRPGLRQNRATGRRLRRSCTIVGRYLAAYGSFMRFDAIPPAETHTKGPVT